MLGSVYVCMCRSVLVHGSLCLRVPNHMGRMCLSMYMLQYVYASVCVPVFVCVCVRVVCVWCGVVWCGVVWCGVVWCGVDVHMCTCAHVFMCICVWTGIRVDFRTCVCMYVTMIWVTYISIYTSV